ncbi:tRNA(Ile)(2)-agmatinylcytidine synthase [Methanococcus voltae]|uniref:tRNA(Ile2) 2-agmatinylcytidine synthetase TiaS n=1 Tax=Methanococcus voltae (strain ATCC BAA-1334 / A3) TaxID=456320 RepID=TIAS_METV3|nr:tRNA(Ile)(2)-agmatinylcytidine synthase [Methanococcus voltae]D7DRZ8.1 RecName: Full=tRNA(Ile2) 2-agmatinylcytidine synthetase TiaS; Short=tRNA(Ile2)-agm2C synthetase; AltName: Full=tRNA(Ile2) agmatidine synthetase [Methanococcus voltae A3]MCS3901433.1 tRNA(Ile2)-agmatinylcytidine synthase [Methanococcus voltae]
MYIGIDDTDSREKYCTTYVGTLIVEELLKLGYILEEPRLIRMNPMVKYKTRGNGGVCLKIVGKIGAEDTKKNNSNKNNSNNGTPKNIEYDYKQALEDFNRGNIDYEALSKESNCKSSLKSHIKSLKSLKSYRTTLNPEITEESYKLSKSEYLEVKTIVSSIVEKYTDFDCSTTNPGIVLINSRLTRQKKAILKNYYNSVLTEIVSLDEAEAIIKKVGAEYIKYKKGLGIIGSLGAISSYFSENQTYTYELLAYRENDKWGTERYVIDSSVVEMDKMTYPYTFNNVDNNKNIIAPNTKCPVLYGIRGVSKEILFNAKEIVESENIDKYMIYRTNQGTDHHLRIMNIADARENTGAILSGYISEEFTEITGGHVLIELTDSTGSINCIAYEPTKKFRHIIRELAIGDLITVYGTIREEPYQLNIEKINVVKLNNLYEKVKKCECGGTLKSKGVSSGYKCNKCGKRLKYDEIPKIQIVRNLREGFYEVPPSARRHLSMPLSLINYLPNNLR